MRMARTGGEPSFTWPRPNGEVAPFPAVRDCGFPNMPSRPCQRIAAQEGKVSAAATTSLEMPPPTKDTFDLAVIKKDGASGLRFRESYGCGREKRRARVTEAETTLP